jgi:hypothetical protein
LLKILGTALGSNSGIEHIYCSRIKETSMRIGIPGETRPGETRVAATPETVKKLVAAKHQVINIAGYKAVMMAPTPTSVSCRC